MNNFKDYGFEADFEGEILKEIEDMSAGKVFIGYIVYDCKVHSCVWQYNGVVITRGVNQLTFNLKPIKKEWYENHENFPCLVIHDNKESVLIKYYNKTNNKLISKDSLVHYSIDRCRPATKEEVLTLLVKE